MCRCIDWMQKWNDLNRADGSRLPDKADTCVACKSRTHQSPIHTERYGGLPPGLAISSWRTKSFGRITEKFKGPLCIAHQLSSFMVPIMHISRVVIRFPSEQREDQPGAAWPFPYSS